ncbi:hypothetical protein [Corynebacterium pacaense]|uniref:hypothetical protein n=1 Tax=Corynebacterium pacaense TaxID=1816684 RepID=UPI0009BC3ACD|nr:hypothetical protein [Corynebacterium pacaense]
MSSREANRQLVAALDRAVQIQSGVIEGYVRRLRRKHPEASPAELQNLIDKHFMRAVSGTGAGVGMAAAVPGIGFFTGALAIGAESAVFLDAVALYTAASAHLRGVDIGDPERRRALILVVLLGAAGTALVDPGARRRGVPAVASISRFSTKRLVEVNGRLLRMALRRFRFTWLGKIMPLGIGAVLGLMANRRLARRALRNTYESLGPL